TALKIDIAGLDDVKDRPVIWLPQVKHVHAAVTVKAPRHATIEALVIAAIAEINPGNLRAGVKSQPGSSAHENSLQKTEHYVLGTPILRRCGVAYERMELRAHHPFDRLELGRQWTSGRK